MAKPAIERLIRSLIEFVTKIQSGGGNRIFALISFGTALWPLVQQAADELKGKSKPELAKIFRVALDNMIGGESDALVGPNDTSLIQLPVGLIHRSTYEGLTDIMIDMIAAAWAGVNISDLKGSGDSPAPEPNNPPTA